jgi:protein-tyrosine phosphatase
LKDHVREQIECIFYDAIEFIEDAVRTKGKVYVHCVQGVSRSATVCLAYLIYKQKMTFNEGLTYIKERRPVANPNMTFIAQLICFYKRLFESSFDSVPTSPRVFMLGSHQPEDPERIVSILVSVLFCP